MKLTPHRLVVALATALLCQAAFAAGPVATVNGKEIPAARMDVIMNEQKSQGVPDTPELRDAIREELIRREVLGQAAEKAGTDKKADVQTQLGLARQAILVRAYLQDHLAKNPVTDAQISDEYEKVKPQMSGSEYKPRHILVETEAEAQKIIDSLRAGEDFAKLAKASKDPGSRDKGGELGWSSADQYVKPFGDALAALKKGEYSKKPVKSDFGYHVIKLDDLRDVQPPSLDELKPQIREFLEQKRIDDHIQTLRGKATVK